VELPLETAAAEDKAATRRRRTEAFYRRQRDCWRGRGGERHRDQRRRRPRREGPGARDRGDAEAMRPGRSWWTSPPSREATAEASEPGKDVVRHGVKVLAPLRPRHHDSHHASQLYARTWPTSSSNMVKKGELQTDADDEIVRDSIAHPRRRGRPPAGREASGSLPCRSAAGVSPVSPRAARRRRRADTPVLL